VPRGAHRFYFAVHPERLRGFIPLMLDPRIDHVCAATLGADYQLVEVGFDVPFPGATAQRWHRDFPVPEETKVSGRPSSVTVNATCVDVVPEMGPFEFAPGSHNDPGTELDDGMYVPTAMAARFDDVRRSYLPQRGDVSIRTGLMIHRGSSNVSDRARPMLIVGMIGAAYPTHLPHALSMTERYFDDLPQSVRDHLHRCDVVRELEPIVQDYVLDGLLAPE
jgi:ectoine hydroxylase-related dioxygenase (phytanoyl-CoA dioxygenase family)